MPAPPRPAQRPASTPIATAATPSPSATAAQQPQAPSAPGGASAPALPPVAAATLQEVVLEGPEFRAVLTNRGAQLLSYRLKKHHDDHGQPLELVRTRGQGPWPLGVVGPDLKPLPLDD